MVASAVLNIQWWVSDNQQSIPILKIFAPAIIHVAPAMRSKALLVTLKFIRKVFDNFYKTSYCKEILFSLSNEKNTVKYSFLLLQYFF